jgi:hypothetical protein
LPIRPRDPRVEERQLQDQPLQTGKLFHRGSKSAKGQVTLPYLTEDINDFQGVQICQKNSGLGWDSNLI